ncbi:MAG: 30S ribosomal protein S12 methylthiotransferase RimO [Treponema sp.]|nr:30S ribosomal protein S12 methylthiotransferase RimO [Treponema sp.]
MDQHGCAKNQTDGELISTFLENDGFKQIFDASQADFIIVNSCGFIKSAKKESIDAVYSIKNNYPDAKIILTGCLAQRYAQDLYDSMPELDGIFGNGDLSKIAEFMHEVEKNKRAVKTYPQTGICTGPRKRLFNYPGSAYVKITEGCSNHCSFCAIPLIRGELRSRTIEDVIQEIKDLLENGVYEINLIGQDLAAFGDDFKKDSYISDRPRVTGLSYLAQLFTEISKLPGEFIVRPLYIHPDHFNTDILQVMKADSRFCKYFDIPFQSGDDQIIQRMNRVGSSEKYQALIKEIRSQLPDCMIRTTFLTGFPGESDQAAQNTLDFLKAIEADWSGCFPYSREDDTPAYNFKNRVPAKVAQKRAEKLEEIQSIITEKRLQRFVSTNQLVLVEEVIDIDQENAEDLSEGLAIGRAWFQAPEVDGCVVIRYDRSEKSEMEAVKVGNLVQVKILSSTGVDLDARFISLKKAFKPSSKIEFRYSN